jgi:hypothetical protein
MFGLVIELLIQGDSDSDVVTLIFTVNSNNVFFLNWLWQGGERVEYQNFDHSNCDRGSNRLHISLFFMYFERSVHRNYALLDRLFN